MPLRILNILKTPERFDKEEYTFILTVSNFTAHITSVCYA